MNQIRKMIFVFIYIARNIHTISTNFQFIVARKDGRNPQVPTPP